MVAIVLAAAVLALERSSMGALAGGLQLGLVGLGLAYVGFAYYRAAWNQLARLRTSMDLLTALGMTSAFGYSVYAFVQGAEQHFGTAAVVLALLAVGTWIERRARSAAERSTKALLAMRSPTALVVRDAEEEEIGLDDVRAGDTVLVRAGTRIPVDGEVVSGASAVDESPVTGEKTPIEKGAGDPVIAGTMNLTGSFRIRATRTAAESTFAQILRVVSAAQENRSPAHRVVGTLSAILVPLTVLCAAAALLHWGVNKGDWDRGFLAMTAVLVAACPCALGLAAPTAVMVGTAIGARRGILIRNARVLRGASRIEGVILDKTGTLTSGRPAVTDIRPIDPDFTERDILRFAAAVEHHSEHPLARAIVDRATTDGITPHEPASDFRTESGGGVYGSVEGRSLYVGRPRGASAKDAVHADLRDEGKTVIVVEILEPAERRVGVIALSDTLRAGVGPAVERLHRLGLPVLLMTGDNEVTARALAKQVRINEVRAEVQPADKEAVVREFQSRGRAVAMVGNGQSDAAAINAASVGIALGAAADVARESGDIVLISGDVRLVPAAIRLCRAVGRRARGGIAWAAIYNAVLLPLAALGFVHPMLAAGAMAATSASVLVNALSVSWVSLDR